MLEIKLILAVKQIDIDGTHAYFYKWFSMAGNERFVQWSQSNCFVLPNCFKFAFAETKTNSENILKKALRHNLKNVNWN